METAREVEEKYIRQGDVALVYVDFPLPSHGLPGLLSAEAAHCAGDQDRYWEMHDAIFERQEELTALIGSEEEPIRDKLLDIAASAGIDAGAVEDCMKSQKYRPMVAGVMSDAAKSGVKVTPTLLVGGTPIQGFVPFADLQEVIEKELAKARSAGGE